MKIIKLNLKSDKYEIQYSHINYLVTKKFLNQIYRCHIIWRLTLILNFGSFSSLNWFHRKALTWIILPKDFNIDVFEGKKAKIFWLRNNYLSSLFWTLVNIFILKNYFALCAPRNLTVTSIYFWSNLEIVRKLILRSINIR